VCESATLIGSPVRFIPGSSQVKTVFRGCAAIGFYTVILWTYSQTSLVFTHMLMKPVCGNDYQRSHTAPTSRDSVPYLMMVVVVVVEVVG